MHFSNRSLLAASCFFLVFLFAAGCASYRGQPATQNSTPTPQAGILSVSTTSLNFSTVVVGQSGTQNLGLSNSGKAPVQVTALSFSDKQFSITGATVPFTILPSASLSLSVSFTPAAAGNDAATLNITSNATAATPAVNLAGTGEKAFANLVVTPASINFGNQNLKTTKSQNVTLQNTGDISMTIQGVTVAGGGFGVTNLAPGVSLAPNEQITFQVWFDPAVAGKSAATLSFLSSNLSSPQTLTVSGDGISASTPPSAPAPNPPAAQHTVQLTWDASASAIMGYLVYRSENSGGSFSPLFGTAITATSYADTTVVAGSTYYYVVTAVAASGTQSVYSNQVTAVVP